jgi:hypothetical protein
VNASAAREQLEVSRREGGRGQFSRNLMREKAIVSPPVLTLSAPSPPRCRLSSSSPSTSPPVPSPGGLVRASLKSEKCNLDFPPLSSSSYRRIALQPSTLVQKSLCARRDEDVLAEMEKERM